MSADLDNQPYDNVEFPVRRPGLGSPGSWIGPHMTPAQREHLIIGSATKDRAYTLATVTEGAITEEDEDAAEDQGQHVGVTSAHVGGETTTTTTSSQFNNVSRAIMDYANASTCRFKHQHNNNNNNVNINAITRIVIQYQYISITIQYEY